MNASGPATISEEVSGEFRVRRTWTAMATAMEVDLYGVDAEHLTAVATAIEDEMLRLDALLSRFQASSEISRLNRSAASGWQRVDADVWQLLALAESYRQATDGFFDVTRAAAISDQRGAAKLELDEARQCVRFLSADVTIDLGGIGKGFALDRVKELLARFDAHSAVVSAGTSSILALGRPPRAAAWTVDVRHPADDSAEPVGRVEMVDRSLSCSVSHRPGQAVSDVVDPHSGLPLPLGEGVVVLAATGAWAEALSTALLAMGRQRATEYLAAAAATKVEVGWLDFSDPKANFAWLVRSHD